MLCNASRLIGVAYIARELARYARLLHASDGDPIHAGRVYTVVRRALG